MEGNLPSQAKAQLYRGDKGQWITALKGNDEYNQNNPW